MVDTDPKVKKEIAPQTDVFLDNFQRLLSLPPDKLPFIEGGSPLGNIRIFQAAPAELAFFNDKENPEAIEILVDPDLPPGYKMLDHDRILKRYGDEFGKRRVSAGPNNTCQSFLVIDNVGQRHLVLNGPIGELMSKFYLDKWDAMRRKYRIDGWIGILGFAFNNGSALFQDFDVLVDKLREMRSDYVLGRIR